MIKNLIAILKRLGVVLWFLAICAFLVTGFCVTILGWDEWVHWQYFSLKVSLTPFVLITLWAVIKYVLYGDSKKT